MTDLAGDPRPDASNLRRTIAEAVARMLMDATEARPELVSLSPRTRIDGVEVFEGDIKLAGNRFEGLVNVHCILGYDDENGNAFETSETFPGRFEGMVQAEGPQIGRLSVDTASFYA